VLASDHSFPLRVARLLTKPPRPPPRAARLGVPPPRAAGLGVRPPPSAARL